MMKFHSTLFQLKNHIQLAKTIYWIKAEKYLKFEYRQIISQKYYETARRSAWVENSRLRD